jgi:hypothetical protein
MERFMIPRVAHCSDGCTSPSRARRETAYEPEDPGIGLAGFRDHRSERPRHGFVLLNLER